MEVIVKEVEDSETQLVFPCLRSITLYGLYNLKGFCLGKEAFVWPSLDKLSKNNSFHLWTINYSKLKLIDTNSGMCDATQDPNSFIKSKQQEEKQCAPSSPQFELRVHIIRITFSRKRLYKVADSRRTASGLEQSQSHRAEPAYWKMEVVSAIIGPIVESLLVPVKKQLGYLFSSTKHVGKMNARMKQLHDTSIDVAKHMEANNISNQEIPTHVPGWLKEVAKIEEDAKRISSIENGCFNLKMRYRRGRTACKTSEVIEKLIKENSEMSWRDVQRPLGKVKSHITSTSALSNDDGDAQDYFKSREHTFKDALESLQQDQKIKVIALCGMGGVGKTTMMEQLKKTAEDKKMFDYVVKVVIGQQINMSKIQQDVAEYIIGKSLSELSQEVRVDRLRIAFEKLSEGKKKVLVILDDIWEMIVLKDIGLSPFPNGFKLLLTSRHENLCTQIAVEASLAFKAARVNVMEELEAHNFFFQIAGDEKKDDQELSQLGSEIVRRCRFLPLAIKLIATTLKFREANVWRDTRLLLKNNNLDENIQEIIKISYDYIKKEEEKAIFMLCGLFPEDFDISVEELTRYAWGLRLLNEVSTLGEARDRTNTCVQNLRSANLLIDSDYIGCVKMHDLVLSFVLGRVSKGDHPWVVNHGDISKLSTMHEMRESCKRISVTCTGISELPTDFRYPNVSLLRLMNGDKSLKFPEDFYVRMESLEVIAYENMQYPLLPRSLPSSTTIRTLILHKCSLIFDCSAIGELLNLEVLSFAHCEISYLPSAIGSLKKLRLLDLTDCVNLGIDEGVLKKLVKLEELYMRVAYKKPIRFTDNNRAKLAEISEHLSALEVEFFDYNDMPKNMKFAKLERFRISIGRGLEKTNHFEKHSFKNELMLVTNKDEILESRINELFGKTELLYLQVDGMNDLEEFLVGSVHLLGHSFSNLKDLTVFKCANLSYLFTASFASGLMKLECLKVSECPILEVLVDCGNDGDGVITFHKLKCLSLNELPQLVGFCNMDNVIELPELVEMRLNGLPNFTSIYPENTCATSSMSSNISAIQPFFNTQNNYILYCLDVDIDNPQVLIDVQVLIPKLEILKITSMDNLKEIWPYQVSSSDKVNACWLRFVQVTSCKHLVNLFPTNPMYMLLHLEELNVDDCGSIEVLFDINVSCVIEIEEFRSNLRSISVQYLGELRELWRMKGESSFDIFSRSFQAVEKIDIRCCEKFVNVLTPTVTNCDVKALMNVSIDGRRPWEESERNIELVQQSHEINVISKAEISEVYGNIPDVESSVNSLKVLKVWNCKDVEVVFEIQSSNNRDTTIHNHQPLLLPYLEYLDICDMDRMIHVWKCNWNKLVIPQNQSQSSFHNLTTIRMFLCHSIKYLFSPPMGKLLPNLKEVNMVECNGIEEVVSNGYDENDEIISTHTNTISFPHLDDLNLTYLPCLKIIDGGNPITFGTTITTTSIHDQFKRFQVGVASWFLCQYSKKITISSCDALSRVFPSYVVGHLDKLEELRISYCKSMVEIFEIERVNNDGVHGTNSVGDGSVGTYTTLTIPRSINMTLLQLPNLMILKVIKCKVLEYIFTSFTLESLKQLKELTIQQCKAIQVIVKEDGENKPTSKSIVFPRLKSLTLADLPNLKGFFFGMIEFRWPLLENVNMYRCPQLGTFTSGQSMAPKLDYIHTCLGKHSLESGLNFHSTNATEECNQVSVGSWYLCLYSKKITISGSDALSRVFPSYVVGQLSKLEELRISYCKSMLEIFETKGVNNDGVHGTNNASDGSDDACTTLTILRSPNMTLLQLQKLTILNIKNCNVLEYIFTSSTLESLKQLKKLTIKRCEAIQVIVKEDGEHTGTSKPIVLPRLKSLTLGDLPNVKGFFLGVNEFRWPSLEKVKMYGCPQMAIFTSGHSVSPKLNYIHTRLGKHSLECSLNFHLTNATHETHADFIKLLQFPGSFSNLIEVDAKDGDILLDSRVIFPCKEWANLKNLEKLCITIGYFEFNLSIEEVFEGPNDDVNETQFVVVFEKLKELTLDGLSNLKHMWKSNQWIVLNFPNLTKVSIKRCGLLEHVFTGCMVGSLSQLQELQIRDCENMEVIVKEVEDSKTEVVFPCLRSITLEDLPLLKGFYLGKEAFVWPSLDTLELYKCPEITVFTSGQSTTPKLKLIDTTSGMCDATQDPNSFIKSKLKEGWQF
ncbi:hypothetical protein LXL04_015251 [Taraxacum kok-saghyz]